jgi:hypothetical protein
VTRHIRSVTRHIRAVTCINSNIFRHLGRKQQNRQTPRLLSVRNDPQPPLDIPRGLEMAKKFGLEFRPPPDA